MEYIGDLKCMIICLPLMFAPCYVIGSTGEKIVFVGDSAGGNFCLTACMKLKQLGIRLPHALLVAYPSTNLRSSVCPSRIMSIIDPILPLGVMVACQQVSLLWFCMWLALEDPKVVFLF